jgi:hypothetical protein
MEATGKPLTSIDPDSGNIRTHFPILHFEHQSLDHIGVMESSLL